MDNKQELAVSVSNTIRAFSRDFSVWRGNPKYKLIKLKSE